MRYVAAYLLSALGGNDNPDAKHIKKILESVGIEADDTRLEKVFVSLNFPSMWKPHLDLSGIYKCHFIQQVLSELKGKKVNDVIAAGMGKLASVPAGGAVAVASSAAAGSGGGGAAAPAAAEEKKEEKKEESEESDDDMGFGLFD
ncbi:large ribosomal subunit protein P2-like isoform X1 [Syngnathoides biaculeatus]|uniref:large ribosomal subunit protein P2-like isoform X1 n=1 Tax=Syngnathoides biaculeatus TaxID=300417 RepID=UPI002ADDAB1F|nr:large ribosomal subunit protein P2-like isoform X1 [Syngnathoides biaculeatus]XP_061671502.1 large ribosomal subunit protein P2-like isoform X1 [Syngnathoides biaculeatus]XP_061671503.1 large ribosomal subunit protein P2-like isoform X1 [Syngnathoides biaculeatus]